MLLCVAVIIRGGHDNGPQDTCRHTLLRFQNIFHMYSSVISYILINAKLQIKLVSQHSLVFPYHFRLDLFFLSWQLTCNL